MNIVSLILATFLFLCLWRDTRCTPFYGGSMSFETFRDSSDGNILKVRVKFLTGWKLRQGPCGSHCDESKIGHDTNTTRQSIIQPKGDIFNFGNWTLESSKADATEKSWILHNITSNMHEIILSVNDKAEWELDSAESIIVLPEDTIYNDIIFVGQEWIPLTLNNLPSSQWHMQIKVNTRSRSDTSQPNRSPVVQMKPFYRLGLNRTYTIHLPVIDPDDDVIECRKSRYIEAGSKLTSLSHQFPGLTIGRDCIIHVDTTDLNKFHTNGTGAITVTVEDFARKNIILKGQASPLRLGYQQPPLSAVSVQFFVFIVERADEPIFIVPPTAKNRQIYTLFVGSKFQTRFYARPTSPDPSRKIKKFFLTRRDGEPVQHSNLIDVGHDRWAMINATWLPKPSDLGNHILCARVEDSEGYESIDMHCFIIKVKPHHPERGVTLTGKPYFVFFPQPGDIVCEVDSYCKFPIFAASGTNGGITDIQMKLSEASDTIIEGGLESVNGTFGPGAKKIEIQFKESDSGVKKICFEAFDSSSSTEMCLLANVHKKDPCEVLPCKSSSQCVANDDNSDYRCICPDENFSGKNCEILPQLCPPHVAENPCKHNGQCFQPMTQLFCLCKPGYTGRYCEHLLKSCSHDTCDKHGVCIEDGNTQHCNCSDGYTGAKCETPPSNPGHCSYSHSCSDCSTHPCANGGVCVPKGGSHECICPIGFKDNDCQQKTTSVSIAPQFVPPTPGTGSVIYCDIFVLGYPSACTFPVFVKSSSMPSISTTLFPKVLTVSVNDTQDAKAPGVPDLYMAVVNITHGKTYAVNESFTVCLQTGTMSQPDQATDNECFSIKYVAAPLTAGPYNPTDGDFVDPTPVDESVISCVQNQKCHFFVYTGLNQTSATKCNSVVVADGEGIKAFTPQELINSCQTDIAYTGTTVTGTKRVCLKSWEKGDSRCFNIAVLPATTDQCTTRPCQNGAACLTQGDGSAKCICTEGFQGAHCEIGPCKKANNNCQNSGFCFTDGSSNKCFCTLSNAGKICGHKSFENVTSPATDGGKFTDSAYPKVVKCYKDKPCMIPHVVTGDPGTVPTVTKGFVDNGVEVQTITVKKDPKTNSTYHTETHLIGTTAGIHKVCVQTKNNHGTNADEVCFKVDVIDASHAGTFTYMDLSLLKEIPPPINRIRPYFVPPTLHDNATLECQRMTPCHITLWISNRDGLQTCPFVKSTIQALDGVHIFQNKGAPVPCMVDVSIDTNTGTSSHPCFTPTTEMISGIGGDGVTRCYNVDIVPILTVKSPCSSKVCKNSGFCDGNTGKCRCLTGYSGGNCEIPQGVSQTDPGTGALPRFGDMAVPSKIQCIVDTDCSLPFTVTGQPMKRPLVQTGYVDSFLTVTTPSIHHDVHTSNDTYLGNLTVTSPKLGIHKLCLQLSADKLKVSDEICVQVEVIGKGTSGGVPNKNQPHFKSPTIPNNSEVICIPRETCHVVLSLSPGVHSGCPSIAKTSGASSTVHVFHSNDNQKVTGNCTADVAITPPSNNSSDKYCFATSLPSIPGEKRCFTVKYQQNAKTTCNGKSCTNAGICMSSQNSWKCECPMTHIGTECQNSGSTSPPITNQNSTFDKYTLPSVVRCERNKECEIPLLVNHVATAGGPNIDFGHIDQSIEAKIPIVQHPPDLPNGVWNVTVPVTGKSNGVHDVCVQVPSSVGVKEHCLKVDIVDPGSNGTVSKVEKTKPHFEQPSLPPGTEVSCIMSEECHMTVNHNINSNGKCDAVSAEKHPGSMKVFSPSTPDSDGACRTEITFTPVSNKTTDVCLKINDISNTGERRCYKFSVQQSKNNTPCESIVCKNNGFCIGKPGEAPKCVCPAGKHGLSCDTEGGTSTVNNTVHVTPGAGIKPKFTDTVIPNIVPCKVNTHCSVPLLVTGNPLKQPMIDTDSPLVEFPIRTEKYPNGPSGTYTVNVKVGGTKVGIQKACVHTLDGSDKADEICFKVNVTDSSYTPPSAGPNHPPSKEMKEPTLPDGSTVDCLEGSTCHILVHTVNNGNCERITQTNVAHGTRIVKTSTVNSTMCVTDVATYAKPGETNKEICLQMDTPLNSADEEKRCIKVNVVQSIPQSPCHSHNCGHGYCTDANQASGAKCICRIGYSGPNCGSSSGPKKIPRPPGAPTVDPAFVDTALPKEVECIKNKPCSIQFPVHASGAGVKVDFGHVDSGITKGPFENTSITDPATQLLTKATITPTESGNKTVCVQTYDTSGHNQDEVCFRVHVKDGTARQNPDMTKPQFISPTVPENSVLECVAGETCHIPMVTSTTSNSCASIKAVPPSDIFAVHSFTPVSPTQAPGGIKKICQTDVALTTDTGNIGTKTVCLKPMEGSKIGETRCIKIKVTPDASKSTGGPCQVLKCQHGKCDADINSNKGACLCPIGFSGNTCQNGEAVKSTNHTLAVQTGTDKAPTFTDTALPDVIPCKINETCGIPLLLTGDPKQPPGLDSDNLIVKKPMSTTRYPGGKNGTYTANIYVQSPKAGIQTACMYTGNSSNKTDEICFKVNVTGGGSNPLKSEKMAEPTLPDGSSVNCEESTVCHILVHTTRNGSGACKKIKQTTSPPCTSILNTRVVDANTCVSDIATCTRPGDKQKEICVQMDTQASSNMEENRCVTVNILPDIEPMGCSPNECNGNGYCIASPTGSICICLLGYTGKNCQNHSGSTLIPRPPNAPTNVDPAFVDTVLPKEISCVKDKPCFFQLPVKGSNIGPNTVHFGHVDPDNKEGPITLTTVTSPTTQTISTVQITPTKSGNSTVCVQTSDLSGKNTDEVCIKVNVGNGVSNTAPGSGNNKPNIVSPTIPPDSVVQCIIGTTCHIPVVTTTQANTCADVKAVVPTELSNVHAFPPASSTPQPNGVKVCQTDVAIRPDAGISGKKSLCLQASKGSDKGNKHCFVVDMVTNNNKTTGGPCQALQCEIGKCDADLSNSTATCLCPVGYSGQKCQIHSGLSSSNHTLPINPAAGAPPKFTDTALPDVIPCKVNTECGIPLLITGDPHQKPDLDTDSLIVKHPVNTSRYPGDKNGTYTANIFVKSPQTGIQTACVHTGSGSNKTDEICFKVNVTRPGSGSSSGNGVSQKMSEPTLPDGSSVNCEEGTVCHILVHTPKNGSGDCKKIRQTSLSPCTSIIRTVSIDITTCVSDIATCTKPGEHQKQVCVKMDTPAASSAEEERCITVNAVPDIKSMGCTPNECGSNGYCIASPTGTTCVCSLGYSGIKCQNQTGPVPIPRPSNTSSNLDPLFVDTALPTEIVCVKNKECSFQLPVKGSNVGPNTVAFGHVDTVNTKGPITLSNVTDPVKQTVSTVRITPTESGNSSVCVQTLDPTGKNTDEVCLRVRVTDAAPTTNVDPNMPNIISPTLPPDSVVQCIIGTTCHIPVMTSTKDNTCGDIKAVSPSDITNIHSFSPSKSSQQAGGNHTCQTDVAIRPSTGTTGVKKLCLQAFKAGNPGNKRCFGVNMVDDKNKITGGPCQVLKCEHGKCEADPAKNIATCLCPVGYNGKRCQSAGSVPIPRPSNTSSIIDPLFVDTALPKEIVCVKNKECSFQLPVKGSNVGPNTVAFGHVDTGNTKGPITLSNVTDPVKQTISTVRITPTESGTSSVCVQTLDPTGKNTDEVCLKVRVTDTAPTTNLDPNMPNIISPTLPPDSVVQCIIGTTCHIPVLTSTKDNTCGDIKAVSPSDITNIHSFSPSKSSQQAGGNHTCQTDVAIRPSTGTTGVKKLCLQAFKAGNPGNKRCFGINMVDDKNKTTGGPCQVLKCEHGKCEADPVKNIATCLCPVGYNGKRCQSVGALSSTNHTVTLNSGSGTTSVFIDTAIPDIIPCKVNTPCGIPLLVTGNPNHVPKLDSDSVVVKRPLTTTRFPGDKNGTYTAHLFVQSPNPGIQTACVHTGSSSKKEDEICFKVNVTSQGSGGSAVSEKMLEPTLPDRSSVLCEENTICHILVHTPTDNNGHCKIIRKVSNVACTTVLKTSAVDSKTCISDVATCTKPGDQNKEVCLQMDTAAQSNQEEKRCITVNIVPDIPAMTCAPNECNGNGYCMTNFAGHTCVCKLGFTGSKCQDSHTFIPIPRPPNSPTNVDSAFVDTSLPREITCVKNQTCSFQLPVGGAQVGPNTVHFGHVDIGNIKGPITLTNVTDPKKQSISTVQIIPTKNGKHTVCVQTLDKNGVNTDEVCLTVNVKNPSTNPTANKSNIDVISPTLPPSSVIQCIIGTTCHLPVVIGTNETACPDIKAVSPSDIINIHAFVPSQSTPQSSGTNLCHTDVAIRPETGSTGKKTLCLQATKDSYVGSKRCYTVDIVSNTSRATGGPCQALQCLNKGTCDSDVLTGKATCLCSTGFSGIRCEQVDGGTTAEVPVTSDTTDYITDISTNSLSEHSAFSSNGACSKLTPKTAKNAASNGRVECTCTKESGAVQVIKIQPKATTEQLVRATGIGAGSVIGALGIAALIYTLRNKLKNVAPSRSFSRSSMTPMLSRKRVLPSKSN